MSIIAGLQKHDIQKHTIIKLLDIIGLDIDPQDGRIYYPEEPDVNIKINEKILCVDIGKKHKNDYMAFNPLAREDHAQFLMQLAVYARIFAGELKEKTAEEADYTINTTVITQDENGVYYDKEIVEVEIVDEHQKVCGHGVHEESSIAVTIAVLDYLWKSSFINESTFKGMVVTIESAWDEYKRIQEMGAFSRKQALYAKGEIFQGPEVEEEFENFADEADEQKDPVFEYTDDDLATELTDEDFEKEDEIIGKESFIDNDFTDKEIDTLFGWCGFDDVDDVEEEDEQVEPQEQVPDDQVTEEVQSAQDTEDDTESLVLESMQDDIQDRISFDTLDTETEEDIPLSTDYEVIHIIEEEVLPRSQEVLALPPPKYRTALPKHQGDSSYDEPGRANIETVYYTPITNPKDDNNPEGWI